MTRIKPDQNKPGSTEQLFGRSGSVAPDDSFCRRLHLDRRGLFIETLSLIVVTIPIIVPLVIEQVFAPIWFGILMIVLIEMALIAFPQIALFPPAALQ